MDTDKPKSSIVNRSGDYINKRERREEMGFIGRTKRTIWMGSPSLHPTYSNFHDLRQIDIMQSDPF